MRQLRVLWGVPLKAMTPERNQPAQRVPAYGRDSLLLSKKGEPSMDNFLKILDRLGAVLGWIVVAIVVMAIGPIVIKILTMLSHFH